MLRMFVRRNELRRSSDRIEGVVVVVLMAAFVAAFVVAGLIAAHIYRSEQATAMATWRTSDGAARTGLLTTDVVPGIYGEPAGAAVQVWLGRSGDPAPPPQGAGGMAIGATMAGLAIIVVAATVLTFCYRLCQRGLDRRRIANWSSDWAVTGPQWTSRQ